LAISANLWNFANSSSSYPSDSSSNERVCKTSMRNMLRTIIVLASTIVGIPSALSLEKERNVTVNAGEKVRIWFGANYGRRCATAGPPIFKLISAPTLGEVTIEEAAYVVPSGESCGGKSYTGLRVWYTARSATGTDTFSYTLEFPHELSNPRPSKGPQPVTATVTIK
jgi:hypothetical protein